MMSVNMRNWLRRRIWISSDFSLMCWSLFAILGVGRGWQKSAMNFELRSEKYEYSIVCEFGRNSL